MTKKTAMRKLEHAYDYLVSRSGKEPLIILGGKIRGNIHPGSVSLQNKIDYEAQTVLGRAMCALVMAPKQ